MADKNRFRPESTEAEIDALVDNIHGRTVDPGVFNKTLFYSSLLDLK